MQTTQAHPTRKSLFIVAIILILVTVLHTQNLFQYPYYQDAEGTSASRNLYSEFLAELNGRYDDVRLPDQFGAHFDADPQFDQHCIYLWDRL